MAFTVHYLFNLFYMCKAFNNTVFINISRFTVVQLNLMLYSNNRSVNC